MFSRILTGLLCVVCMATAPAAGRDFWVSGYYPCWDQQKLPPEKIPFEAITHLFHFALIIHPDGSFATANTEMTDAHIKATVAAGHSAGKKVVIVLGGADSENGFRSASSAANRTQFIANIAGFVAKHHYDGVDLDWEPLRKEDNGQYKTFVTELHAALKKQDPSALLTAATGPNHLNADIGRLFADIQDNFDQINVMTYVLSGAWEGWISWFGSPLYHGGAKFSNGRDLPSIENQMADFMAAGVRTEKLGIGIAFHGDVWSGGAGTSTGGVTLPRQGWTLPPKVRSDVAYSEIMAQYYSAERFRFDQVSQTPFLSIDEPGSEHDMFVSYCDAAAIATRLRFLEEKKFGGCIIWQLCADVLPSGEQPLAVPLARFLSRTNGKSQGASD